MNARLLAGTVILALLTGCGFHLRGTGEFNVSIDSVHLVAAPGEFAGAVETAFAAADVALEPLPDLATYTLHVSQERNSRRVVSTTSNITAAEYQLRMAVEIVMTDAAGEPLIEPTSLFVERIYRVDATSLVGSNQEEEQLRREMRRELANQVLRRVDATARAETT